MRTGPAAMLTALVVLLALAAPVGAVTGGEQDGDGHPYVGFVAMYSGSPDHPDASTFIRRCSGFLVSPTVFVTAGHCGRPAADGTPVGFARVWADAHVDGDPATGQGLVGGVVGQSVSLYPADDIGVVVLSQGIAAERYAALPAAGAADGLANHAALDVLGYGYSGRGDVTGPPAGRWTGGIDRLITGSSMIPAAAGRTADLLEHSNGSVGTGGSACFGDSGGPILPAGTDVALAFNAYVDNVNCSGIAYGVRLDLQARLDWLRSFLP